jgi:hypothetical protein
MELRIDAEASALYDEALVRQLIESTSTVLEQYGIFDQQKRMEMARDLLFSIGAVLGGSAYAGAVEGNLVSPFIGYYLDGAASPLLIPESGSCLHELVPSLVDELLSK